MFERVIIDVEADGLLDSLSVIHSLVLRDLDTGDVMSCAVEQDNYQCIEDGLSLLSKADMIFGHNLVGYDMPALVKVYPDFRAAARLFDTLVAVRTRFAHIKETDFQLWRQGQLPGRLIGTHKLEAWGYRLGMLKGKFHETADWKEWSPEMQEYCERDTNITRLLLQHLKKYGYPKRAVDMEHDLAVYLRQAEYGGWPFDEAQAHELHATLSARREDVAQELRNVFGQLTVKNGKPFTPKRDNAKLGYKAGETIQRYKQVDFNPASRDHVVMVLMDRYGWEPTLLNDGDGKPKVDDAVLKKLDYPEVPLLREYFMLTKRLGQLSDGGQAWMKLATRDRTYGGFLTGLSHIHGYINPGGTVTHRASHSHPNIAQVPKVGSKYGAECRALFIVPKGWKLVGSDMSGLELRCLAHYMSRYDGGKYTKTILEGDIHQENADALTLDRDRAKTWFYAFLYGAGDGKLGKIVGSGKSRGTKDRAKFKDAFPALKYLLAALDKKVAAKGWIQLIDDRRAYVRHTHAALNTLLQGTGAVLCKAWLVCVCARLEAKLGPMGWDREWQLVGWIHDELQIACKEEHAPLVERVCVESAEYMTELFDFRCPLTGEAKTGNNWSETH